MRLGCRLDVRSLSFRWLLDGRSPQSGGQGQGLELGNTCARVGSAAVAADLSPHPPWTRTGAAAALKRNNSGRSAAFSTTSRVPIPHLQGTGFPWRNCTRIYMERQAPGASLPSSGCASRPGFRRLHPGPRASHPYRGCTARRGASARNPYGVGRLQPRVERSLRSATRGGEAQPGAGGRNFISSLPARPPPQARGISGPCSRVSR